MRFMRKGAKNRKPSQAQSPRRHSTALTLDFPIHADAFEKPEKATTITMIPQDSSASLPSAPASPHGGRPVAQPPYSWKRPNLSDILSNEAQEPWTLAAFTDYCQQNLCLENLNFIMEVKEYEQRYEEWEFSGRPAQKSDALLTTWRRIVQEFATPGGPQEINLPYNVRHDLSVRPSSDLPPHPSLLKPALRKIHELMQDSILLSFLNDVHPPSVFEDRLDIHDDSHFDDGKFKSRSIQIASGSPPTGGNFSAYQHKHSTASTTSSGHHPSVSSYRSGRRRSIASAREVGESTGNASTFSLEAADSGSESGSPSDGVPSRAAPTSAPRFGEVPERRSSPRPRGDSSGWAKLSAKLGLKKTTSGGSKHRKESGNTHGAISE